MSYCVNCGVKSDPALKKCPLCNTPVINPKELHEQIEEVSLFPKETAPLERVRRKDWGLLLTIVLTATAFSCGLLNALVFRNSLWSLLIIGMCILVWVFAIPTVIYSKISVYFSLLFDGFAVAAYLFMISYVTPSKDWLIYLALPITAVVTVQAILFAFLFCKVSSSFLATALYIFIEIPVLCIVIELLIRKFMDKDIMLTWSAVVLTACAVIIVAFITIISKKRLRNAVRRRLHF